MSVKIREEIISWLLEGDVAIQFQVWRDLLSKKKAAIQKRIAQEGYGARILECQHESGHWGSGYYSPKWTSSHYTLLLLRHLNIDPYHAAPRKALRLIFKGAKAQDGGIGTSPGARLSDVCVNGMMLNIASYFQVAQEELVSLVDFLLMQRMPDGGFNCRSNHGNPTHSSLHSTLSVLEGIHTYLRNGYSYRHDELKMAEALCREFILVHRFYRSDKSGEVIKPAFLKFCYPHHWYYDIMRALDYFQAADVAYDVRMDDALSVLLQRQTKDGRWKLSKPHSGRVHFHMEKAGSASRWNTLRALRILNRYT